ncbi:MAG TPA: MarR family transcriptional regulator [Marmoricola sp.]|nr:MarR family transcriptional regulator [Marmoricola sp.]
MSSTTVDSALAEVAGELRTVINRLAFHLRTPAMESGITPTRLSTLVALERSGPLRPGELAGWLGITAASMSRLCDALEGSDLVRRAPDPDDHRATRLSLTDHGAAELARVRRAGTAELMDDIAALSTGERDALEAALPVLVALADKHLGATENR